MNEGPSDSYRVVLFTVFPAIVPVYEQVLAERGHTLLALFTAPGPRTRRSEDYREVMGHARPGLDVVVSNQPGRWAKLVTAFDPDLLLCFGFNWKLPAAVLAVLPLGAVNCHGALLPQGRGINSIGWAFRSADPYMGLTYHYMTPELDDGPILSQAAFLLTDEDDIDTVAGPFFEHVPGRCTPHSNGLRLAIPAIHRTKAKPQTLPDLNQSGCLSTGQSQHVTSIFRSAAGGEIVVRPGARLVRSTAFSPAWSRRNLFRLWMSDIELACPAQCSNGTQKPC